MSITIEKVKQLHPEVFNSIFQAGIKSERSRVNTWLNNSGEDVQKLKSGIASGEFPKTKNKDLDNFNTELDKVLSNQ